MKFSRVLFNASSVAALVIALSCSPATQRKLIVSVNDAQDAAAQTYNDAKTLEATSEVECRAALNRAAAPLPTTPDQIRPNCAAVGVTIPYDPIKLQQAAGPINSLFDTVRAANAARTAKADGALPADVIAALVDVFGQVAVDMAAAGVPLPQKFTDAIAVVKSAKGTP